MLKELYGVAGYELKESADGRVTFDDIRMLHIAMSVHVKRGRKQTRYVKFCAQNIYNVFTNPVGYLAPDINNFSGDSEKWLAAADADFAKSAEAAGVSVRDFIRGCGLDPTPWEEWQRGGLRALLVWAKFPWAWMAEGREKVQ